MEGRALREFTPNKAALHYIVKTTVSLWENSADRRDTDEEPRARGIMGASIGNPKAAFLEPGTSLMEMRIPIVAVVEIGC